MMACANASNILGEATSASGNTSIEAMRGVHAALAAQGTIDNDPKGIQHHENPPVK